jgi:hypothetical protein
MMRTQALSRRKKSSLCLAIAMAGGLASSIVMAQSYEMRISVSGLKKAGPVGLSVPVNLLR